MAFKSAVPRYAITLPILGSNRPAWIPAMASARRMYSRPFVASLKIFLNRETCLATFASSTKVSGQSRLIRSSLSTKRPAFGTLEGGYESEAFAVNARGQVVGAATNGIPDPSSIVGVSTQVRAFLWQN